MIAPVFIGEAFKPLFFNMFSYYGFPGGRATAKSHTIATYAICAAMRQNEIIVTGRENKNANDHSTKRLYESKIKDFGYERYFYITKTEIICRKTDSTFNFVGLQHNPDSIRSFEGATITVIEEAQNVSQRAFDALLPTVMRTPRARFIANWNPISEHDAVDRLFRGAHPLPRSYCSRVLTYRDNPYFYTADLREIREQMEHMKRTNPDKYKHVWEGGYFGGAQKRIFNNWRVEARDMPAHIFPQYGVDFGGSRDPNAIVKLYVNDAEKEIYIAREFYAPGDLNTLSIGLGAVVEKPGQKIVCDSAWPQSIAFIKQTYPNACAARKGPNSILEGINWLQGYKIIIHPGCKNMIAEADGYSWKTDMHRVNDDGSPVMLEVPESGADHLWDAARYATEQNRMEKARRPRLRRLFF